MPVQAEIYRAHNQQAVVLARTMSTFGRAKLVVGDYFGARAYLSRADVIFQENARHKEELDNLMELYRAETQYGREQYRRRLSALIREIGQAKQRKQFLLMSYGLDRVIDWFKNKRRSLGG